MSKEQPAGEPVQAGGRKRRRLRRLLRTVQWTVNGLAALWVIFVFTPAGDSLGERLMHIDPLSKADYIVVLGGDNARAVEAASLYRHGWAPKVIISSLGDDPDRLARIARHYGLPDDVVLCDRQARRTAHHPRTIAELPRIDKQTQRFLIVTSPYHTARARACFLKAGYKHVVMRGLGWRSGGDFCPRETGWAARAYHLPGHLREAASWILYRIMGWL